MKIICFMKYPRKGRVKTRLAKAVGESAALDLYKDMLSEVSAVLADLNEDFQTELCYAGASHEEMQGAFPDFEMTEQIEGGLGDKLQARMAKHFAESGQYLCFIGSDCVDLDEELFEQVRMLFMLGKDVVIGPSDDGGYYLIAVRKDYQFLFEGIDWSTERVYQQTVEKVVDHDLELAVLDEKTDLDTLEVLPESWKEKFKGLLR